MKQTLEPLLDKNLKMRKTLLFLLILSSALLQAQIKAITDQGDEVILYTNGTWKYLNKIPDASTIQENSTKFTKSESAGFLLKSKILKVGFWLDPQKWSFKKAVSNEDAEFELQLKEEGDVYAVIIVEKFPFPLEALRHIAVENLRTMIPDVEIVKEEYRNVNGLKILMLEMNGLFHGAEFTFLGYYYSGKDGAVQYTVYTSPEILETQRSQVEQLLNGFVEID